MGARENQVVGVEAVRLVDEAALELLLEVLDGQRVELLDDGLPVEVGDPLLALHQRRHPATAIDFAPHAFIAAVTVQAALVELLDKLLTTAAGDLGLKRVGADATAGTLHALSPGTVDSQFSQPLAWLNAHVGAINGAHNASAIAALPHNYVSTNKVQAQLQESVDDLESQLVHTRRSAGGQREDVRLAALAELKLDA